MSSVAILYIWGGEFGRLEGFCNMGVSLCRVSDRKPTSPLCPTTHIYVCTWQCMCEDIIFTLALPMLSCLGTTTITQACNNHQNSHHSTAHVLCREHFHSTVHCHVHVHVLYTVHVALAGLLYLPLYMYTSK